MYSEMYKIAVDMINDGATDDDIWSSLEEYFPNSGENIETIIWDAHEHGI